MADAPATTGQQAQSPTPPRRRRARQPQRVYVVAALSTVVLIGAGVFVGREMAPHPHEATVTVDSLKRDAGDPIVRPERLEIPR